MQISIWGSVQSLRLLTKNQAITWLRIINTSQLIDRTNISDAGRRGNPEKGGAEAAAPSFIKEIQEVQGGKKHHTIMM
jgi:hypothetical protein